MNVLSVPSGSDGEESACKAGDLSLIPGLGQSPGERNSYLLQLGKQLWKHLVTIESNIIINAKYYLILFLFLPGESHGQRSLVGHRPCGHKESDSSEQLTLRTVNLYLQKWSVIRTV